MDNLVQVMTPDCVTHYDNGAISYKSCQEIIDFFKGIISLPHLLHFHQAHHPEIELVSSTEAKGNWYFQDLVYDMKGKTRLDGAGIYSDRYRKVDGAWRISHTGYRRVFEVIVPVGDVINWRSGVAEGLFNGSQNLFDDL
jgi:hypothetical protein